MKTTSRTPVDYKEKYYMASQWRLMFSKLRKHALARFSMWLLFLLYFGALFANFLGPYGLTSYNGSMVNAPPSRIHVFHEGQLRAPFVYGMVSIRDQETLRKSFVEDKDSLYPIKFFAKGEEYKLFGLFGARRHLFTVDEPGTIFLFGADGMGRDLFSRVLLGSQVSLTIPFVGTAISFVIGVLLGGISGYFGGLIDTVMQRIIEVLTSFPTLPLWIALGAAIPPRVPVVQMYFFITVILAFIAWTGLARVVRGKFLSLRNEDFVMAAKIAGVSDMKIIFTHLVPSFMSVLLVSITLGIPGMILGETSMSFLGLGIRSPATSWGVLLQEAQSVQNVALYPWRLIPLGFVVLTVLAFNFLGDGMRDAADPYK